MKRGLVGSLSKCMCTGTVFIPSSQPGMSQSSPSVYAQQESCYALHVGNDVVVGWGIGFVFVFKSSLRLFSVF